MGTKEKVKQSRHLYNMSEGNDETRGWDYENYKLGLTGFLE
jgi:hypothetical protein